jgi:hypothetical protein
MRNAELLGFRNGLSSVHTSRTMMLEELSLVFDNVAPNSPAKEYVAAIVENNLLGKPTQTTRQRSAQRLVQLYSLDLNCTLFRLLRHFWPADPSGRPMLALLIAAARDPLLRESMPSILAVAIGEAVDPTAIGKQLNEKYPGRFSPTTLHSTAQNLASTWTQAGYLLGKVKKTRTKPHATPSVAAFALVLGYLCGLRGKLLLESTWTRLLDRSPAELTAISIEASKQGWINFKSAGVVVEITFPGLLKPEEERAAHEQD